MELSNKNLEANLLKYNLINPEQLEKAKLEISLVTRNPPSLQSVLLNQGFVSEDVLLKMWAKELGLNFLELEGLSPDPAVVTRLPEEMCVAKGIIALEMQDRNLGVAMENPNDVVALENVESLTGLKARPVLASRGAILRKLSEYHDHYKIKVVEKLLAATQDQGAQLTRSMGIDIQSMEQVTDQAPVIKTVNLIILGALLKRASDIHLIPDRKYMHVKYRIDGILQENQVLPIGSSGAVVSRIKIMCKLDIAERRMPQDGSFHLKIEGREIDFRVAVTPTIAGEKVVMRVLDKSAMLLGLDHLGFEGQALLELKQSIRKPHGIILIVGPTGSGKTTTLYSALQALNTGDKNITTVEDPVEYEIEGLTQIQVHSEIGLDFAACLRSILRQDPDIILVGEIRDLETTEIAIRAALTGHLVFATLHTNDAAGAVTRLTEMGAEPYLIASSLRCAVSQRLVRTICPKCREAYQPSPEMARHLAPKGAPMAPGTMVYRGRGCTHCFNTGYRGRSVIAEYLKVTEEIRLKVIQHAPTSEINKVALAEGMRSMFADGMEKILKGVTTFEEVLGVTEDLG